MRREDKDTTHAPALFISEVVPCAMGEGHKISIAMDEHDAVTHISSTCLLTAEEHEAVRRLGGQSCSKAALAFIDGVENSSTYGYLADAKGKLPKISLELLSNAGEFASSMRNSRGTSKRSTVTKVPTITERTEALVIAKVQSLTKLPAIRLVLNKKQYDDGDSERTQWSLKFGGNTVATRAWGSRGWKFDELRIGELLDGNTDSVFVCPTTGRDSYTKGENTLCLACNKTFRNRRGHTTTDRHCNNVIRKLRKVMRAFPGPKAARKND